MCTGFLYLQGAGLLFVEERGFSCYGAWALGAWVPVVVAHGLSSCGSRVLERRLSSCGARVLERRLSSCGAWF